MSIASEIARLQQAKADLKTAINSKGGNITTERIDQFASEVASLPSPKEEEDGDYLVRFFDYDGTILKEQWVNHGEDATPPDLPDYSEATNKRPALTFQGWNNSYTNITGNKDIGAIYVPTDDKTHAYVRLTVKSGKDVTLYLNKTDTSTLSIDWGDNITTTHTNSGNFNTSHTYSDYGDYEIKVWISSGSGEYGFGNGDVSSVFVGGAQQTQRDMLMYLFVGNNVSSIGNYAFYDCYSLTDISLPANVSSIGIYAFEGCVSLTSIVIPESVSSLGTNAFAYCHSLTSINLPANLSSIGDFAFQSCFCLTNIVIPANLSSIGKYAFRYCHSLTSIDLPASVSDIAEGAFADCRSLTSFVIPEGVSSIGGGGFSDCDSLTSIVIPESVSSIGTNAFRYCRSLTSIDLPANLSSMGNYAFQSCRSLTNIVIPESVSSIGSSAFESSNSILKYVFNRTTPPTLASTSAFRYINSICKIYVPDASVTAYKSATNWVTYADYIYPISEMEGDN